MLRYWLNWYCVSTKIEQYKSNLDEIYQLEQMELKANILNKMK